MGEVGGERVRICAALSSMDIMIGGRLVGEDGGERERICAALSPMDMVVGGRFVAEVGGERENCGAGAAVTTGQSAITIATLNTWRRVRGDIVSVRSVR